MFNTVLRQRRERPTVRLAGPADGETSEDVKTKSYTPVDDGYGNDVHANPS